MLYAILIFGSEEHVEQMPQEDYAALMERHAALRDDLSTEKRIGPAIRLQRSTSMTIRGERGGTAVLDGPFTETKEQLMGIYVIDCPTIEDARSAASRLAFETAVLVIRPIADFIPGVVQAPLMSADR